MSEAIPTNAAPDEHSPGRTGPVEVEEGPSGLVELGRPEQDRPEMIRGGPRAGWVLILAASFIIASALQFANPGRRGFVIVAICGCVLIAATLSDVATRRISNRLTYPAVVLGVVLNLGGSLLAEFAPNNSLPIWLGSTGVFDAGMGFAVSLAVGLVSFTLRGLGGGDTKLVAAVGAMLGLELFTAVFFNSIVAAAAIGGLNWLSRGWLLSSLQAALLRLYGRLYRLREDRPVYRFRPKESPYALSLAAGFLAYPAVALHRVLLGVTW